MMTSRATQELFSFSNKELTDLKINSSYVMTCYRNPTKEKKGKKKEKE